MIKLTSESPIGDILARFRALTGSTADDKNLMKRGKGKLLAAIEQAVAKLEETPEPTTVEEPANSLDAEVAEEIASGQHDGADLEPPKAEKPAKAPKAKKPKKEKKAKKEKGPVIRAEAEKLLLKVVSREENRAYGMPYEAILTELAKTFPEAKTTVACLRWYAVHMRERGEKVPARPRATPAKPVADAA